MPDSFAFIMASNVLIEGSSSPPPGGGGGVTYPGRDVIVEDAAHVAQAVEDSLVELCQVDVVVAVVLDAGGVVVVELRVGGDSLPNWVLWSWLAQPTWRVDRCGWPWCSWPSSRFHLQSVRDLVGNCEGEPRRCRDRPQASGRAG